MMTELKPCPFCGEDAIRADDPHAHYVTCTKCWVNNDPRFLNVASTAEKAAVEWNTRSLPAALDVVIEAVRLNPGKIEPVVNESVQFIDEVGRMREVFVGESERLIAMLEALKDGA